MIKVIYNLLCKRMDMILLLIINKLCYFISIALYVFIKRDSKSIAISCRSQCDTSDMFMHNTKYLFLYLNNHNEGFKCVWLSDDVKMIEKLKQYGYKNVYKRSSLKGLLFSLKAKYWIYDYEPATINNTFCYNAILINLWHGTGSLKKCGKDAFSFTKYGFLNKLYDFFRIQETYYNVDSEREGLYRQRAFNAKDKQIVINGSPRLDVLFKDIKGQEILMEEDFNIIRKIKEQEKTLFLYVPTFRDTKEDISSWLKSKSLDNFLTQNNSVLVCKLHPFDTNLLKNKLSDNFIFLDSSTDLYPILQYFNALITDYSSVYFDYLLLDKPIIYYVPDLDEYQAKCRGFYEPYENLTAGIKTTNENELLIALQDVINGIDKYKQKRIALRDMSFKYNDGKNCERLITWLKHLNKQ